MIDFKNLYKNNKKKKLFKKIINKTFKNSYPSFYLDKIIKNRNKELLINKDVIPKNQNIYLIGFGKVAPYMVHALVKILGISNIKKGILISPNYKEIKFHNKILSLEGTHPKPSLISKKSTQKLLKFVNKLNKDDVVICAVSGGGSTCLSSPIKGITLNDEIRLNNMLILESFRIDHKNSIKGYFSNVKNGKLAEKISPAKIFNFIISDDPRNVINSVGSGATVHSSISKKKVLNIINKNKLMNKLPKNIKLNLKKKEINKNKIFKNTKNIIIFDNKKFLKNFKDSAKLENFNKIVICPKILNGDVEKAKKIFLDYINKFKKIKNCLILFGSEAEVGVKNKKGLGGRLQHFAAICLKDISKKFNGFLFLGLSTDGHDYMKNIAGVMYDDNDALKILKSQLFYEESINKYNSYKLFKKFSLLLNLKKPTKNNVFDIIGFYIK